MLRTLFRTGPSRTRIDALYARAVAQARMPGFYTAMGVADRIDARFELYTLHVLLLILRLRETGEEGGDLGQALFDTYVSALDHALRELGVSDVAVGKKMRKLGEALYGRMQAYETALAADDADALSAAIARNVLDSEDIETGRLLARYVLDSRARLTAQDMKALERGPDWAEVKA